MEKARKTAFISGSARNIGRDRIQLCGWLQHRCERGLTVCMRSVVSRVRQAGVTLLLRWEMSVAVPMCARWPARFLINWAGRYSCEQCSHRPRKSLLEMSDEDWDQVISVDLNGAFYLFPRVSAKDGRCRLGAHH